MRMILIGHRGVGKTSLLQRLLIYNAMSGNEIPLFDLDREIEKSTQKKIGEIFEFIGEANFRKMELDLFERLTRFKNFVISVGAGFQLSKAKIPKDTEIVWVRRYGDSQGRIFLDRPRLNQNLRPLEEYKERFQERNILFSDCANWIYDIPEGLSSASNIEKSIFRNTIDKISGGFTILPEHSKNFEQFKARFWRWDFSFFEIRDDLLTENDIENFLSILSKEQVLLSFRKQQPSSLMLKAAQDGYRTDYALELLDINFKEQLGADVISLHERHEGETVSSAIERLESSSLVDQHKKLAIEIYNFEELALGLKWHAENPHMRSFLPRSKNGRWTWVRLWLKGRQILNFVREGAGSSSDQPTIYQWLSQLPITENFSPKGFAAVLGSPVWHSYSPNEHRSFFDDKKMAFYSIEISKDNDLKEWNSAISLLEKMGAVAFAVTSPFKKAAAKFADETIGEYNSINTLVKSQGHWIGTSTDLVGFKSLVDSAGGEEALLPAAVWGGGGTLEMIQNILPKAAFVSSRMNEPQVQESKIKTLIWAASPDAQMPPLKWKPELVIDLNYRDDSFAKEYCQQTGARYMSGLEMFLVQAQAQQEFWSQYL